MTEKQKNELKNYVVDPDKVKNFQEQVKLSSVNKEIFKKDIILKPIKNELKNEKEQKNG